MWVPHVGILPEVQGAFADEIFLYFHAGEGQGFHCRQSNCHVRTQDIRIVLQGQGAAA